MISFLYSILGFIAAIAVLVTIHEFGHYWVAKKMGVKVLRFSVGFGKPIWMKKAGPDQTEYAIAAIPFGGYVKMLDEREGKVADHEKHRAFTQQSVYKRFAIVFAGPLFNFLFAIAAYWLLFVSGVAGVKPIIGDIDPNSVAGKAGLIEQQQILSVNGQKTPSWSTARYYMLQDSIDANVLNITVLEGSQQKQIQLDVSQVDILKDQTDVLDELGITRWRPKIAAAINEVNPGGAADRAGFEAGDAIVSINGEEIDDISRWVALIQSHAGQEMTVVVDRNGQQKTLKPIPDIKIVKEKTYGYLGVRNKVDIPDSIRQEITVIETYSIFDSFSKAVSRTWDVSWLTLKVLGKLVMGEASIKNLSGPITIAQYAGVSVQIGLEAFLSFMALISISLGVMNLLPVPMLDGGHLFYYLIEIVKGSAVSEQFELMGQKVGMFLLLCFMSIAIYNDLLRLIN